MATLDGARALGPRRRHRLARAGQAGRRRHRRPAAAALHAGAARRATSTSPPTSCSRPSGADVDDVWVDGRRLVGRRPTDDVRRRRRPSDGAGRRRGAVRPPRRPRRHLIAPARRIWRTGPPVVARHDVDMGRTCHDGRCDDRTGPTPMIVRRHLGHDAPPSSSPRSGWSSRRRVARSHHPDASSPEAAWAGSAPRRGSSSAGPTGSGRRRRTPATTRSRSTSWRR